MRMKKRLQESVDWVIKSQLETLSVFGVKMRVTGRLRALVVTGRNVNAWECEDDERFVGKFVRIFSFSSQLNSFVC